MAYYYIDKDKLYRLLKGLEEIYRKIGDEGFSAITVEDTVTVGRTPQTNMEVANKKYVDDTCSSFAEDKLDESLKGAVNGLAELDQNGVVPNEQLPSYIYNHIVTNKGSAHNSGFYKVTTNSEGHVTSVEAVTKADITNLGIPGADTHYASKNVVGLINATENTDTALTNGNVYLNSVENGAITSSHKISGTGSTIVVTDNNGNIIINSKQYSSEPAESEGTTLSLVTTGEKYRWNNNVGSVVSVSSGVGLAGGEITSSGTIKANLASETPLSDDATGDNKIYPIAVDKSGYLAVSVPWIDTDIDTKNTAGATDTSNKIYLIGATSQDANPQTYSHDSVYVGTDGCLYSNDTKVLTAHQDISGKIDTSLKGAPNGLAELDENGLVPSYQLPSYVDDILEYASISVFPTTGETGKIYVDITTNLTYRWSGTTYVEISQSLAIGTTSSTAFRGDYGEAAYTHAVINKGSAFNSGLYKITTNNEGHVTEATAVTKSDITGLGIPGSDTTYSNATTSSDGLMSSQDKTKLDGVANGANNYVHPSYTAESSGLYKVTVDNTGHVSSVEAVVKSDITDLGIPGSDTTYSAATTETDGLMSSEDKTKLNGIATGANAYVHPSYTAQESGLYKVTIDSLGHVSAVSGVTKSDITDLGIPESDTTYSTATTEADGLMSSSDKTKLNGIDTGANAYVHPSYTAQESGLYKVTVDSTGHVSAVTDVQKSDITSLGIPESDTTYDNATTEADGLMSSSDKTKLNGIETGANAYVHPSYTAESSGLYKVAVDSTGHVSEVTAVEKSDITALGIPESDTTYSNATTSSDGLMSSEDKTKLNGIDTGANNYTHPTYTSHTSGLYKVTVDTFGHVSGATAVEKSDITSLGIPAQDTTYSVATTSSNGLMSSTDKTFLSGITATPLLALGNIYVCVDESGYALTDENSTLLTGGSNLGLLMGDTAHNLADADYSVAIGTYVTASAIGAVAFGKYNDGSANYAFTVGNGTADNARSNAIAISWSGDATVAGTVTASTPTSSSHLTTKGYVDGNFLQLTGGTLSGPLTATSFIGNLSGTATSVGHSITIKIASGTTEGTNQFTFNGSATKTLDITKSAIGLGNVTNNAQIKGLASGTTSGHVVTFGSDGYTVQDSGYTIGKSVPSNAVFTDTTYSTATASANGLMPSGMFSALNVSASQNGKVLCVSNGALTWMTIREALGLTSNDSILYLTESSS